MTTGNNTSSEQQTFTRRCICCRSKSQKLGLLRFAVLGGELCFDLRKKLPSRGYYVCAKPSCLKKAFDGVLKRSSKKDTQSIAPNMEQFVKDILLPGLAKRLDECLLAGRQNTSLIMGADSVEQAAKSDMLLGYIVASDASAATAEKYRQNAERKGLYYYIGTDRSHYGQLLGKSDKVVLGWLRGRLGEEFYELITMLTSFEQDPKQGETTK